MEIRMTIASIEAQLAPSGDPTAALLKREVVALTVLAVSGAGDFLTLRADRDAPLRVDQPITVTITTEETQ